MKIYKIPPNSYLVEDSNFLLFHEGKITVLNVMVERLMGDVQLITFLGPAGQQGPKFILSPDRPTFGYSPSLLREASVLQLERNPTKIEVIMKAIKSRDSNAVLFEPSPMFRGKRSGYVYKRDFKGLGYYLDKIQLIRDAGQDARPDLNPIFLSLAEEEKVAPKETNGLAWTASGELVPSENGNIPGPGGREAMLYQHFLKQNEKTWGPDSLPTYFQ